MSSLDKKSQAENLNIKMFPWMNELGTMDK